MADNSIGALPLASGVADDSLLVMEQQGEAMRITGGMLKGYAKQGVELEFQEYLDDAQQAAESAVGAVGAVVDMTVDAHTLETGQSATVAKTMKNGKVNLSFGLPRGDQGIPGPSGPPGPTGPQGEPGTGLDIVGRYDTTGDVPDPQEGKSYYIGTQPPYDVCTYLDGQWVNNGPLSGGGGGGGPLPENVVTSQGGASIEYGAGLGDAPHTIRFTDEDDEPLTAAEISFDPADTGIEAANVQGALEELFTSVSDGKSLIASAITDKGVATAEDAAFAQMAEHIRQIPTGGDASDATATPGDILSPKTAYTGSGKVEGIIPSLAAQTIVPGTQDKTIANGQYLAGTQTVKGDPNLTPANIRKGVTLFEVDGAMESSFKAALTVTADIGAVVTATCGDTEVEALSVTGTVMLELPIEGTWKVTAVRGAAQYNTVTLEVSSSYSASLTAEVHIEYYGTAENLSAERNQLAAVTASGRAFFGGGRASSGATNRTDYYDENLVHGFFNIQGTTWTTDRYRLAAASAGGCAIFAGGYNPNVSPYGKKDVDAYDSNLTLRSVPSLFAAKYDHAGASIGNYALFGGGSNGNSATSAVDCYDSDFTHTAATPLALAASELAAASNAEYALFGGGGLPITAYDESLTRSTPAALSEAKVKPAAARAGNYVLIAGGSVNYRPSDKVDAYDLFLTRVSAEPLSVSRDSFAGTTLRDYAVFGGWSTESSNRGAVDVYDAFLTRTVPAPLAARRDLAAAAVGDFALFGGGSDGSYVSDTVSVYHYV